MHPTRLNKKSIRLYPKNKENNIYKHVIAINSNKKSGGAIQ